jgi:hypothetical protein
MRGWGVFELEGDFSFPDGGIASAGYAETKFFTDSLHPIIISEDIGCDLCDLLIASYL